MATQKATSLYSIFEKMSNGKLTLKYELNVSLKTSSTLEVLSWFSQVSCQHITWQSWEKEVRRRAW